ncbi:unnamed protein product [Mytilus coruscus]|uniref:Uncharacterized protein n=1 Tax=Mytilus coruscus TaxID=42192 RepID=A0A6J8AUQ9_MYTCO|nr:unnamed protein product [Mytilus coruscus]
MPFGGCTLQADNDDSYAIHAIASGSKTATALNGIPSTDNTNYVCEPVTVTGITASADGAYQRRGSGRSLSGTASLIGKKTGKVAGYSARYKRCRKSDAQEPDLTVIPGPSEDNCEHIEKVVVFYDLETTGLSNKKFLLGDKPCQADCSVFGIIGNAYWQSFGSSVESAVKRMDVSSGFCKEGLLLIEPWKY